MEKMLEYQEIDKQLFQIQKQLGMSNSKKSTDSIQNEMSKLSNQIAEIENKAKRHYEIFNELQTQIEKNLKNVEILNNQKIDALDEKGLDNFQEKSNIVKKNITILEQNMLSLQKSIQKELEEYAKLNSQLKSMIESNNVLKVQKEEKSKELEPQIEELKNKLSTLQKSLDKNLFEKYLKRRNDNMMPVFVPLQNDRCGYCRMSLPVATVKKIQDGDMVECEQCRRYIFDEK